MSRSQSGDDFFITIQFYHIFYITLLNSTHQQHAVYVINEIQKNSKVAPTFDVTSLTLTTEEDEFSEYVFEVQ